MMARPSTTAPARRSRRRRRRGPHGCACALDRRGGACEAARVVVVAYRGRRDRRGRRGLLRRACPRAALPCSARAAPHRRAHRSGSGAVRRARGPTTRRARRGCRGAGPQGHPRGKETKAAAVAPRRTVSNCPYDFVYAVPGLGRQKIISFFYLSSTTCYFRCVLAFLL
jgi:hypothetical protein